VHGSRQLGTTTTTACRVMAFVLPVRSNAVPPCDTPHPAAHEQSPARLVVIVFVVNTVNAAVSHAFTIYPVSIHVDVLSAGGAVSAVVAMSCEHAGSKESLQLFLVINGCKRKKRKKGNNNCL